MSILDVLSGGNTPTILCLAVGALCVFWLLTKRKGYSVRHYQKIPLLTQREQEFFWRLKEAVGNDLVISPQVPFGAFILAHKYMKFINGSCHNCKSYFRYKKSPEKTGDF